MHQTPVSGKVHKCRFLYYWRILFVDKLMIWGLFLSRINIFLQIDELLKCPRVFFRCSFRGEGRNKVWGRTNFRDFCWRQCDCFAYIWRACKSDRHQFHVFEWDSFSLWLYYSILVRFSHTGFKSTNIEQFIV